MADIRLADRLFAPHYVRAETCSCIVGAMLRSEPAEDSTAVSQLLPGEAFELLDRVGNWAWGRSAHDGYVGYLPTEALGARIVPTHRVTAPLALVFARPDIKSPVIARLPVGARLAGETADSFVRVENGFVHLRHVTPVGSGPVDATVMAERLIGLPYLWGGRGQGGIDCSGLVQLALSFADVAAPRDSDQQRALGRALDEDEALQRGDLIFFPGHVGLMTNGTEMIHANAFWMAVTVEPLADVIARLAPHHSDPVAARRRIEA